MIKEIAFVTLADNLNVTEVLSIKREIINVIFNVTDRCTMRKFLINMSKGDLEVLTSLLSFVDKTIEQEWLSVYNEVFSGMK